MQALFAGVSKALMRLVNCDPDPGLIAFGGDDLVALPVALDLVVRVTIVQCYLDWECQLCLTCRPGSG